MKKLTVSAIIPTLNRVDHLSKCLPSIRDQILKPDEVILVDQSDDRKTEEFFKSFEMPGIRKKYVKQETKSLILARNNGIRAVTDSEFITFLDDDLVLLPDFFEKIMARFAQDTKEEFGGGTGTVQGSEFKARLLQRIFMIQHSGSGHFLPSGCPTFPHWKKEYCEVEFLSGGDTTYRKDVLLKNMFDERLMGYGYGDDIDVSYRVSRKYKMFYEPAAICIHDEHSPGRDPGSKHRKGLIQNMYYLNEKNLGPGFKNKFFFWWMTLGYIIDDLINLRRSALIGNFIAIRNILKGDLDTVIGYRDFKRELSK